jgi:hypothetical protein
MTNILDLDCQDSQNYCSNINGHLRLMPGLTVHHKTDQPMYHVHVLYYMKVVSVFFSFVKIYFHGVHNGIRTRNISSNWHRLPR